jgi:hypothetical protein
MAEGPGVFEWFKARVLRFMKVPHEPEPPLGAPGSVRVFRAGRNYYRLKVLRWGLGQVGAIIGIGFSLFFLRGFGAAVDESGRAFALESASIAATPSPAPAGSLPAEPRSTAERKRERERGFRNVLSSYVLPLILFLEIGGLAVFVVQMLLTFAIVRLEFEQHWYIVTDRSLRIRTGIFRLQESTMSFANIQQVEIRQGPLQRILGLADVCVRSAGGGDPGAGANGHRHEEPLHTGVFVGVSNALEIRDLILDRLRRFRETGLGDPEDRRTAPTASGGGGSSSMKQAAAELLAEARALRETLLAGTAEPW